MKERKQKADLPDMDRKQFIKTVGAAVGALGLGLTTGRVEAKVDRNDMQGFIRTLLQQPELAKDFLTDPQGIARTHGIIISQDDAIKIDEAVGNSIRKIVKPQEVARGPGGAQMADCSWHDFPECEHVVVNTKRPGEQIINPPGEFRPGGGQMADCGWHDFAECDHVASNVRPGEQIINPQRRFQENR